MEESREHGYEPLGSANPVKASSPVKVTFVFSFISYYATELQRGNGTAYRCEVSTE